MKGNLRKEKGKDKTYGFLVNLELLNGDWAGYFDHMKDKIEETISIKFIEDGSVEGSGENEFGPFTLRGKFTPFPMKENDDGEDDIGKFSAVRS